MLRGGAPLDDVEAMPLHDPKRVILESTVEAFAPTEKVVNPASSMVLSAFTLDLQASQTLASGAFTAVSTVIFMDVSCSLFAPLVARGGESSTRECVSPAGEQPGTATYRIVNLDACGVDLQQVRE
jgi:hypothetical protein